MQNFAIMLAAYGSARRQALAELHEIENYFKNLFPQNPISLCFTSGHIYKALQKRLTSLEWVGGAGVDEAWLRGISGVLRGLGRLRDSGARNVLVQPLHIFSGEDHLNLAALINGLNSQPYLRPSARPFDLLALSRPALGEPGPAHPYGRDIKRAALALADDVHQALQEGMALVYMGHGNRNYSTGVYQELEAELAALHSEACVSIGVLEGYFGLDYVVARLRRAKAEKVLLKPLLLTGGGHVQEDMCGDESWQAGLIEQGFTVQCSAKSLAHNPAWLELYVENLRQTALASGLEI